MRIIAQHVCEVSCVVRPTIRLHKLDFYFDVVAVPVVPVCSVFHFSTTKLMMLTTDVDFCYVHLLFFAQDLQALCEYPQPDNISNEHVKTGNK